MAYYGFMPAKDTGNRKLGAVHNVYSPAANCPDDCPFKGNGCYADNPPLKWQWDKVQSGESKRSVSFDGLIGKLQRIPIGEPVRLNVAGDLPMLPGPLLPGEKRKVGTVSLMRLAIATRFTRAWTYTHHDIWGDSSFRCQLQYLAKHYEHFTVNVSTEDEGALDVCMTILGLPAVIAVPSTETRRRWETEGGNRVLICPAQTCSHVTCETCMLCHKRPDDLAIAFRAHGTFKKKADDAIANANRGHAPDARVAALL